MRCAACDAALEVEGVFPGARVACRACGAPNRVPAAAPGASPTPYRTADARPALAEPALSCPFCGGGCAGDARACPHCDVRLSNVRCPTCFTLQPTGAETCARCGHALELEPLPDATSAPCPRCARPLDALAGDAGMRECARCGGLFVDHPALARVVEEREKEGPLPVPDARPFEIVHRGGLTETAVTYVKCPTCSARMNRVNFGRKSGVVVDVCKMHGTWFDAGELTRAVEWVSSGGLAHARAAAANAKGGAPQDPRVAQALAMAEAQMKLEALRDTREIALTADLVDAALRALLFW